MAALNLNPDHYEWPHYEGFRGSDFRLFNFWLELLLVYLNYVFLALRALRRLFLFSNEITNVKSKSYLRSALGPLQISKRASSILKFYRFLSKSARVLFMCTDLEHNLQNYDKNTVFPQIVSSLE